MTAGSLQNMGVSSSKEAYFVFAVGLLLSLNSGYINGLCISGLLAEGGSHKQGVSAFTGTYTKSGLALANGEVNLFGFEFTLILSFIGGAMAAGMMNPKAIPHKLSPAYGPTFLIGSLCMIAASTSAALFPDGKALYYFAAMACGVQNGMTSTYSANLIRTTHLTGTSTDIGLIMGQMIRGNWKNYWKFKILVGLAASFWLGSLISFYSASAFLSNSLWFSAALYLAIGLTHVTFVVLTQNVSFVQAFVGTWHWDRALERMAMSINVCEGSTALATLTPAQIDNAFDQIDANGSGNIDTDELKEALEKMGIKLTKRNVVTMINVVDENGDGNIDREEFHLLVNMTTMRAKHKQESKKKRSTIVNYAKSHIPKPSFRMDDASSSSNMKSSDKEGEEGEDHDHSVGIQQRHLPRTYQDPSGKGDDRAIIITETKPPFTIVGVNEPWEDLCGYKSDIGLIMGQMIRGNWKNYWKFKILVGLAVSFWLGSLISFYSASAFLSNSLWFSSALYLAIGLTHVTFVVLTQNVSFVQAFVGTWHWDRALERMAMSINVCEGSTALATLTPAQIDNAFDQIDANGSGNIDTDELKEALEKMGIKLTKKNVVTMINVVDENGDGTIDREEFHVLVNMATMRAKHKQESKKKRSTNVNYAKSHVPKPISRVDDASPSSNIKSSHEEGEEGEDDDHSVGIRQRHLPRTYQEALPSGKGDDRAIIITETKPPFTIVGVNEPWEDLCGYKSSEVVNKSMSGLIQGPKTNNMGLKHAIDKLSKGADQVECTTVNYRKDGSMFTNLLTMGPMYNEDEEDEEMGRREAAYYVGMLTNVGERAQDMSHMDEPEEKDDGGNA
eukprot:CAMPEP_0196159808 /NCGR_PEP_ID=MMETSP0910-20130528/46508_1 /TAXON_ID=49265 /ORGANISM="Thalassiosira rotula, Strain GSO102" /LENGTH=842 /DNA_ID=CAMNT_0041424733 /DNA_START=55 /DNA_END=2583 /DNA_ORIENTATION=-